MRGKSFRISPRGFKVPAVELHNADYKRKTSYTQGAFHPPRNPPVIPQNKADVKIGPPIKSS